VLQERVRTGGEILNGGGRVVIAYMFGQPPSTYRRALSSLDV
jgi:hypothetical protein